MCFLIYTLLVIKGINQFEEEKLCFIVVVKTFLREALPIKLAKVFLHLCHYCFNEPFLLETHMKGVSKNGNKYIYIYVIFLCIYAYVYTYT